MKSKSAGLRIRGVTAPASGALKGAQVQRKASEIGSVVTFYLMGAGSVLDVAGSRLRAFQLGSIDDDVAEIRDDFAKIGGDMHDLVTREVGRFG